MQAKTQDVLVNVTEIHTTYSPDKANEYLSKGWVLPSIATGQVNWSTRFHAGVCLLPRQARRRPSSQLIAFGG